MLGVHSARIKPAPHLAPGDSPAAPLEAAPAPEPASEHVVDVERARACAPAPEPEAELELEIESPALTWRSTFHDREVEAAYVEGELRDAFYRRTLRFFAAYSCLACIVLMLELLPGRRADHYAPVARIVAMLLLKLGAMGFCAAARRARLPLGVAQPFIATLLCALIVLLVVFTPQRSLQMLGLDADAYGVEPRSFERVAVIVVAVVMCSGLFVPLDVPYFALVVAWAVAIHVAAEAAMPTERCGAALGARDAIAWLLPLGVAFGAVVTRARTQRGQWFFRRSVIAAARRWRDAESAAMDARAREVSAQSATDARAKLIRIVMHDLRSPLLSVHGLARGLAEAGTERTLGEPAVRASVQALGTCATLMEGIVSDMLDFERIDSGRLVLVHQAFSAAKLLRDAKDTLGALAERKGVGLVFEPLPPELERAQFVGDARRLLQCLSNGVSNAVKFVEPAQGRVVVRAWEGPPPRAPPPPSSAHSPPRHGCAVSAAESPAAGDAGAGAAGAEREGAGAWSTLHIAVQDNGIGLSEAELGVLGAGALFQQVGKGQLQGSGGTGLGLAIVRAILRMHDHSELHLHSDGHRRGTTFEMRLRLRRAPAPRVLDEGSSASATTLAPSPAPPQRRLMPAIARISLSSARPHSPASSPGSRLRHAEPRGGARPTSSRAIVAETAPLESAPAAPSRAYSVRCLHVEDDGMLQLMVGEQLFKKCGVRWETAADGLAALEAVAAAEAAGEPISFILMDNQMPTMGGTQCTATLRARGFTGLIAGVTGDPTGSPDRAEFEAVGLDACFDKTSDGLAAIEGMLRAHVEDRATAAAAASAEAAWHSDVVASAT